MAGEQDPSVANREAREYSIKMQAKLKNGTSNDSIAQTQDEIVQAPESGMPKAFDTNSKFDIKIVATSLSDANALEEAIADPSKPHIEAYLLNSDESAKSK